MPPKVEPAAPEPRYRLLYRIPEACELLSLGKSSIYEAIARGELEACHYHGAVRVPHEALAAFVERLRAKEGESR